MRITKKILYSILLILVTQNAVARKYYINATFSSECPITIYANGESYVLTEAREYATNGAGVVIIHTSGNLELSFSAYNKDGIRITQYTKNDKRDSNGNIEYTRIILGGTGGTSSLDNNSSNNGYIIDNEENPLSEGIDETPSKPLLSDNTSDFSSDANDYRSTKEYVANKIVDTGMKVIDLIGNTATNIYVTDTNGYLNFDGYPNIQIAIGASRAYGEFVRFKWCNGGLGGFVLYGGVGKDWLFNGHNKKKLSWHAAIGYFLTFGYDTNQDLSIASCYAETPVIAGGTLNLDITYSYFFGDNKRFGLFCGGAIGVGNVKEALKERSENEKFPGKPVWDLHFGFAVKLWQR